MSGIPGTFVQVAGKGHESAVSSLRALAKREPAVRGYWDITLDPAFPWVRLYAAATEELEGLSRLISKSLNRRLVVVDCPSNVQALAYFHYCNGALQRALVAGMKEEGVWSRVAGQQDDWESSSWLAQEAPIEGRSHSGSLTEISDLVFEHFRLPGRDQEVRRFGPAWPMRMLGLFW